MALEPAQPAAPASRTIYACPMHPEIEQDHPGSCPKCGMDLEPKTITAEAGDADHELADMTWRFWVAAALSVPVFLLAMLPMAGLAIDHWLGPWHAWLQLLLSAPVVLWAGWPILERGLRSIATGNLNMFTLIALGTSAAFLYSLVAVVFPGWIPEAFQHHGRPEVYFEAAAVIVTLVLLGQVLELRARRRTSSAIRELLSLAPPVAHRTSGGREEDVPLAAVARGDERAPTGEVDRRRGPRARDRAAKSGRLPRDSRRRHRGDGAGPRGAHRQARAAGRAGCAARWRASGASCQTAAARLDSHARRRGLAAGGPFSRVRHHQAHHAGRRPRLAPLGAADRHADGR
jgi:hypothetical protein